VAVEAMAVLGDARQVLVDRSTDLHRMLLGS
jgi:hypothetical protein